MKWNFPSNNFGQEFGLNDAGIETFTGTKYTSLAREVIQNTIDARATLDKPVRVEFSLHTISNENIPGLNGLIEIMDSGKSFWEAKKNAKTVDFFKKAKNVLQQPKQKILKISDYNTIGLTGAADETGNWHSLIKAVGTSNKASTAGGSFGIGKHAPFACSKSRTVFYGTYNNEGTKAFQGVSKLATHLNTNNETTMGTGYFGSTERNKPILKEYSTLDPLFNRNHQGTDIFVMNFLEENHWDYLIIKSVIENFFLSILNGSLVVVVNQTEINESSISALIEKLFKEEKRFDTYYFFKAIQEGIKHNLSFITEDDATFFIYSDRELPNKSAMLRSTGMKIFDKSYRSVSKYVAVFVANGDSLNETLRKMETPSHDKWEPERLDSDQKNGRKLIKSIDEKLRSIIANLNINLDTEEIHLNELSQFLPDEEIELENFDKDDKDLESNKNIDKDNKPSEIKVRQIKPKSTVNSGEVNSEDESSASDPKPELGNADHNTPPNGDSKRSGNGKGLPGSLSKGDKAKDKKPNYLPAKITGTRVFMVNEDNGEYVVNFSSDKSCSLQLSLDVVGDAGRDTVGIAQVKKKFSSEFVPLENRKLIGPIDVIENEKQYLIVQIEDLGRYALGVTFNEVRR